MLAGRVVTKQTARTLTVPAPVGGLNGRDGLAEMAATDAYLLDNWVPGTATVDSRAGNAAFATGLGAAVESLEVYGGGAARKLLGFAGGNIFNVTGGGAVGAALQAGRNSNKIISAMFSNAGSQFLIGVSGLDVAFSYDGTTVTNLVMTGMTGSAANLSYVFAFKGRLYFAQKDQLGFYYLAVGAIQGALSYFDLAQVAKEGGYLAAIASFSADSGNGPADYIVFITSMGEYIVYGGFDPTNAANWGLVGRYYAAPPIGRKCAFNYGSDLVILTTGGALPFSAIRREGGIAEDDAITYKLGDRLQERNANTTVHGWQAALYSHKGLFLINVPLEASEAGAYIQFVQNTKTKAWTRFTNLNGICWTEFEGKLYFGKYDGRVMLYDGGSQLDDGGPIQLDCKQAYNYFDDGSGFIGPSNKHFHFAKLLMACDGTPPISAQLNVDYVEDQPQIVAVPPSSGTLWDVSDWDTSSWGAEVNTQFFMFSMGKYGIAGSLWLRAQLQGLTLKWYATQYIYDKAAGLL
jgi:hypothetical protein